MSYGLLAIFLSLLLLEAFFAASEIALVSADRRRLQHRAEGGQRDARLALKLLSQPGYFFATTLLGAFMSASANTILATAFLLDLLGSHGEVVAILVLPPLILILGEIIPKSIGRQHATVLAETLAPGVWAASWVLYPVTLVFSGLSRGTLFLLGVRKPSHLPFITREDLHLVVQQSGPEVDLETPERRIIHRILHFSLRAVKEVMVPLIRVAAIPDTANVSQALREFHATRFSRLLVYHRRIDDLIGVLHGIDLLGEEPSQQDLKPFIRPAHFVPEMKKIDLLLAEMQRLGVHLAVVVDEYGGAVGIVTLEDLLEEIVGEIADEFDQEVTPYQKLGTGHYFVNARMEIQALNEFLHLDLPEGEYETLAGFLISQLGDLPRVGENITFRNLRFLVRQADARAVKEVELFIDGDDP